MVLSRLAALEVRIGSIPVVSRRRLVEFVRSVLGWTLKSGLGRLTLMLASLFDSTLRRSSYIPPFWAMAPRLLQLQCTRDFVYDGDT